MGPRSPERYPAVMRRFRLGSAVVLLIIAGCGSDGPPASGVDGPGLLASAAEVMAAVGLAQNLGALRALATEGIQRGHMALHARQMAIAAGASREQVPDIAARLVAEGTVRLDRAEEILAEMASGQEPGDLRKTASG